jgi:DNA (cytosine-5)-methyltransferase 1
MYQSCFGRADYYQVEDVWNTEKIIANIPRQRADLASASFPCVDLSLAGNMKGLNGAQSGAFYGFLRVLGALQKTNKLPKAVLLENVIGFLASHDGKAFRIALKALSDLGYYVDAFVVDAKYFVPQSRPRLFLLGFLPELTSGSTRTDRWPSSPTSWLTAPAETSMRPDQLVRELKETALETGWMPLFLPPLPPENRTLDRVIETAESEDWWNRSLVNKHLAEMHASHRDRVEQLRRRDSLTVGTIYRRVREGKSRSEVRTDGLAGCLRTPRGGSSKGAAVSRSC